MEFGKDLYSGLAQEMLSEKLKKYKKYCEKIRKIEEKEQLQSKIAMIEKVLKCQK